VAIDSWKFPDDLGLDVIAAIQTSAWLIYLFRSVRVERVFKHHDWEQTVPATTLGLA